MCQNICKCDKEFLYIPMTAVTPRIYILVLNDSSVNLAIFIVRALLSHCCTILCFVVNCRIGAEILKVCVKWNKNHHRGGEAH